MKRANLPFKVIEAAQKGDVEAATAILKHFEGFIASACLCPYMDNDGSIRSFVDDDLRYHAEIALLDAIFKFQLREPPDDIAG